jgi:hypothetical protein
MSRRAGRRSRPAPERRAMQERYRKPAKRRPLTDAPSWDAPITSRRRWAAVLTGTVVSVVAFSLMANAIVTAGDGDHRAAIVSGLAAALLVPVLMIGIGFVSRASSPWRIGTLSGLAALVVGGVVTFVARDPATGYVAGIGIGAASSLRLDVGAHRVGWRRWTAVGLALYTKVVFLLAPGLAIVAAPLLPVAGIAIIDSVTERQLSDQGRPLP